MPIRPELRPLYPPPDQWQEIRARVLARAREQCEKCGKPNRVWVETVTVPELRAMYWRLPELPRNGSRWTNQHGQQCRVTVSPPLIRSVRVVVTVAHVDGDPTENTDSNFGAWCQWCHLSHDRAQHRESRIFFRDLRRPLFEQFAAEYVITNAPRWLRRAIDSGQLRLP